jgi:dihydrofolate reductase
MFKIIACINKKRAIGKDGKLLYSIKNDLANFKNMTVGNVVIMGRKTFESLPKGPLPNRRNIVISSTLKDGDIPGVEIAENVMQAILKANPTEPKEEVFVIGGASVYKQALELNLVENIYLTVVDDIVEEADAFFPPIPNDYDIVWGECHSKDDKNKYDYTFEEWKKVK